MENAEATVEKAVTRVRHLLTEELSPNYLFHNHNRTAERYELVQPFAEAMELSEEETLQLQIATLFMDTGYVHSAEEHEQHSADMAREFLLEEGAEEEFIQQVEELILSTRWGKEPDGPLQKILHDIQWAFLGEKRFFGLADLLRLEWENIHKKEIDEFDWAQRMQRMLVEKNYYTAYAREENLSRKIKNIAKQRAEVIKAEKVQIRHKTGKEFGRGVDTVYRVTLRNHINLSRIADGKANMIISINTVVLSVLITAGSAGFTTYKDQITENLHLLAPVVILMLSSLTAVVFAVLSALPKVSSQPFSEEDLKEHKVSLLYFGNFLQLSKDDFVGYLRELKKDQEILYDDLSRDLYTLGMVLKKKYQLLTMAYRIFVMGLVVSLVTFLAMGVLGNVVVW